MIQISTDFTRSILNLACTIQAVPAPTFHEEPRAVFFLEAFRKLGLSDVQQDAAGNVLGRLPGKYGKSSTSRPLVVSAHMDTVHPLGTPLTTKVLNDRIIGPGIGDNALGLAALIGLIQMLQERQVHLPGDLWIAANVGEEGLGDLRGMKAVVDRFEGLPIAYLVVEGMGLGTVLHRGLGVERFRVSVKTPGGHSWANYGQPSAIHILCKLVTRLTAITLPQEPCTTMNVGVISGGTSINTIAAHASMELDLRSEDRKALESLVTEAKRVVFAAQHPSVRVDMEQIGKRLAGELREDHPLVELARDTLKELGIFLRLDISSTDANLPLSRGYPAVCVGITNGACAHTTDEYILTDPVAFGLPQLFGLVTRAWEKLA